LLALLFLDATQFRSRFEEACACTFGVERGALLSCHQLQWTRVVDPRIHTQTKGVRGTKCASGEHLKLKLGGS
jgi:hypothetical protein